MEEKKATCKCGKTELKVVTEFATYLDANLSTCSVVCPVCETKVCLTNG